MLTTISLFSVIGSRLFTIPIADWWSAISMESMVYNNRSAIGGLLFGLLGLFVSQRVFGFNRPMLDLYAWISPVALGIVKFGCLFNGCCFGIPTTGDWGLHYAQGTHAHFNQWSAGLLASDTALTTALHPVQLYESLLLFIIGFIVWRTKNFLKKNASALLFSLVLFFLMRFAVEFARDGAGSQFSLVFYLGLRSYQWSMLAYALLSALLLWRYEYYNRTELVKGRQSTPYVQTDFIYVVCLSMGLFTFRYLLSPYEIIAIWMKFIPAIILVMVYLFTDYRLKNYRLLTSFIMLAPLYVFSQTVVRDSVTVTTYHRIDVGGSFGNFSNEIQFDPQQSNCGTSFSSEYYEQVYQVYGLGYSRVKTKENQTMRYGANLSAGRITSSNISELLNSSDNTSEFIYGFNPYFRYDGKWLGGGIGVQLGNFRRNSEQSIEADNIDDANKEFNLLPEFYARVGPRKYLDIDYNYGFLMPSAFPTLYSRSSIGSAFGLSEDYSFRYGYIWNLDTGYISAEALLTQQLGVHLMYIFKEDDFSGIENINTGKFVFSLNYRFGHKTK
jgi:phosphatidylglycerol:prolipoprotein diacylglycerol transferase